MALAGGVGRDRDRQPSRPPLNVEQREVVESPLESATVLRTVQFLEAGDWQVPARAHPDRQAERIGSIEGGDVAETDLRVAVEGRGAADLTNVEGRVTSNHAAVLIAAGDVREAPVELVVRREPFSIDIIVLRTGIVGAGAHGLRLLPLALRRLDLLSLERGFAGFDLGVEIVEQLLLCRRRQQDRRRCVSTPAVEPLLGHVIEERKELIELLVADRIELVRVATRAGHGQAHERRRRRLDAVHDVLDLVLVGDRAAFEIDHVVAVESGRHLLIASRIREQIAGELLDHELVERQIPVERPDHPVAPRPHAAIAVDVVAVRVGIPGGVEPRHGHPLAIVRRLQERIDAPFVGVGRTVGEKGVELGRRRWQPRQVVGDAAKESRLVGLLRRLEALGLEPGEDEAVDRIPDPVVLPESIGRRRLRAHRRRVGPVRIPFGAFVNPAPQQLDLFGRQRVPGIGRRHPLLGIGVGDPLDQHAPGCAPGHDDAVLRKRAFLRVEVELGLAFGRVRTVAGEAVVGKDRPNVAIEAERLRAGLARTRSGTRRAGQSQAK